MTSRRRTTSAALLLAGLLAGTGCSSGSSSSAPGPSTGLSTGPTSPSAPTSAGSAPGTDSSPSGIVERVVLSNRDLAGSGLRARLVPGGAAVRGQPTLDGCGTAIRSERDRIDRRQVNLLAGARDIGASNEVVEYDTPEHAAGALSELRRAVSHCPPHRFVHLSGHPHVLLRYLSSTVSTMRRPSLPENLVLRQTVVMKGSSRRLFGYFVFEVSGAVLDGTYFNTGARPTARDLSGFDQVVGLVTHKLTAGSVTS